MRKPAITSMKLDDLLELKSSVEAALQAHAAEMQAKLARITGTTGTTARRETGSALKGRKLPPKFKGPNGELWSGRGLAPKWVGKNREKWRIAA